MKDARSFSQETQEKLRLTAIEAVVRHNKTQTETAKLLGVSRQSVSTWVNKYKRNGKNSIRAGVKGRPKQSSKLLSWQAANIVKLISDFTPDHLKFPFMLWTREAVAALIFSKYQIQFSKWTIGRILKRWGFTPQKPAKKSYFQNENSVQEWLKREYPKIKKEAKKQKAEIQWLDEMGTRSDDQVGRTYSRRGVTPVVPVSGLRFKCNFISTITNLGKLRFMSFKDRFVAAVFIKFLERLIKNSKRKIFLILDSHPVHKKSKKVLTWVNNNKHKICFYYLPAYSPELNPTEYLNQDVKTNTVRKKKSLSQKELVDNVVSYFRKRQKQPEKVRNYFNAPAVKYAA